MLLLLWRLGGLRRRAFRVGTLTIVAVVTHQSMFPQFPGAWVSPSAQMAGSYPQVVAVYIWSLTLLTYALFAGFCTLIDTNLTGVLVTRQPRRKSRTNTNPSAKGPPPRRMHSFVPLPEHAEGPCLILGEVADLHSGIPSYMPFYLPEAGLYTNTLVLGSVGAGKTAGLLYPMLDQLIAYRAKDPQHRIGGLVFDAKDDFAQRVRTVCAHHGRDLDFRHLTVNGPYLVNPIHGTDMTGQVVAALFASLTAQVMGESREAFWKGQYMVLVDNMVEGLRAAFDYVTPLDLSLAANPERAEHFITYLEAVVAEPGTILVYRNLLTNTETPWEASQTDDGETRTLLPLLPGRPSLTADPLERFRAILAEKSMDIKTLTPALYAHWHAYVNEVFAQEHSDQEQTWLEAHPPQGAADQPHLFEAFLRDLLNPETPDKAASFEVACRLLGFDLAPLALDQPFAPRNPFAHDQFDGGPQVIHFWRIPDQPLIRGLIRKLRLHHLVVDPGRVRRARAFLTWYTDRWLGKDHELRAKIFGGPETIINFFAGDGIRETFAPSLVTFMDAQLNPGRQSKTLLPDFDQLMSDGVWLCVGIPKPRYHRVTDILCTLLKQQFQCAALTRMSPDKRRRFPHYHFDRPVCLLIDEYHIFATAGDTPDSDNHFLSLNRQSRVFFIGATQTLENIRGKFHNNEAYTGQLLGCVRNKVFMSVEDPKSAKFASDMVGKGLVYRVSSSMGENQSDSPYSVFAGTYQAHEAGLTQSQTYSQMMEERLQPRIFLELPAFHAIAVCFTGYERHVVRLVAKPYWRDADEAYAWQCAHGILPKVGNARIP